MFHEMTIAGCKRQLPLCRISDDLYIGAFIMFSDVEITVNAARELLKKAPEGTGIIAGGPARAVCELAGIQNIRTKSLGSNNKQNVVLATIEGLKAIMDPEDIARLRGKSVAEILN